MLLGMVDIEALVWTFASRALELGTNVILDFGFWAREEREDYRSRAKQLGASSEVHFLEVSAEELMRRLARRNSQPSHLPNKFLSSRSDDDSPGWCSSNAQRPTNLSAESRGREVALKLTVATCQVSG